MSRAHTVCFSENVSFILYLLNDNYHDINRKRMEIVYTHGNDGLTDTVGQLLQSFTLYDREILKLLYYHLDISVNCMYSPYRRSNHYK